jgi:Protein of unknown function (DUF4013)
MDIGRAFTYAYKDPKWPTKVLIFGLLGLIPIFGWCVDLGYSLRIIRNVVNGNDVPLPEWDNIGVIFADGLKAFFVALIWSVPAIIIGVIFGLIDNTFFDLLSRLVFAATTVFVLAAIVPLALTGQIAEALQFQVIVNRVLANMPDYAVIFVFAIIVGAISSAGIFGVCISFLLAILVVWLAQSHLAAQAYVRSIGASTPPKNQAF